MVLQLPTLYIVNAYLYPSNTRTDVSEWSTVDPCQKLEEVLTGLSEQALPVYLAGDLNARTGQATARPGDPSRCSRDTGDRTPRGNWLLRVANETGLTILNGAMSVDAQRGDYTSYQSRGNTVIGYGLISLTHLDLVKHFSVDAQCTYSDHAVLHVRLSVQIQRRQRAKHRPPECSIDDVLLQDPFSELDRQLNDLLAMSHTWEDAMSDLYGPLLVDDPEPIQVYTDGSCLNGGKPGASAGIGVYWGPLNGSNLCEALPGPIQTNNRAELHAIRRCLEQADPLRALHVYSDSEYAIRSIAEWAPARAELNWSCANGDVLEDIHLLVRRRHAALKLIWVQGHGKNSHNRAADALARDGALLPRLDVQPAIHFPSQRASADGSPLDRPKVSASIPARTVNPEVKDTLFEKLPDIHNEPWFRLRDGTWSQDPSRWCDRKRDSHRHRAHRTQIRQSNLARLLAAKTPGAFWSLVKEWCTGRSAHNEVPPDRMESAFEERLHGPDTPPPQFDTDWRDSVRNEVSMLPERTDDTSADGIWSRPFTAAEVAAGKLLLTAHLDSASGIDKKAYADVLRIPNAEIVSLLTRCLTERAIPTMWLTSLLVAVPKAKGPYDDPENFRMIGLECCLLKLMTLLLDKRLREYIDRERILPASQNGFRPTFRTENNPFVLRTAVETARSNKKPVYAAFVDLRNAFPSVNHDILWYKLWKMGVSGPLFDWLRKLYANMRYRLRQKDGLSREMTAELGILMGDPGSPLAFLLYLADFTTPAHPDDVLLDGIPVAHLEHADDMVLLSTSPEGLQSKLDAMAEWASKNQMEINTRKTKIMVFPRPHASPLPPHQFQIYAAHLETVDEFCYVGVWFSTRTGNLWDTHFTKTSQKARRTANISFFIESHTGSLPPWQGRSLYSAQISPHLTWATEVTGLGTLAQLGKLEAVQLAFLRRLLGLQKRSQRCILFTESGLWPIRFRRLDLQLRYLSYAARQPGEHFARIALNQQYALDAEGRSCWLSELRRHLYGAGIDLPQLPDPSTVEECISKLKETMTATIESEVLASPKLDILRHRAEYDAKGHASALVMKFRPYLRIEDRAVRYALTRILVSDHRFSVELLRRKTPERQYYIPRRERLCRFCMNATEDPMHALFVCHGSLDLLRCRDDFWEQFNLSLQASRLAETGNRSRKRRLQLASLEELQSMQPEVLFFRLIGEETTARVVGSFALRVFEIFDKCDLYVPDWVPEWKEDESGDE